MLSAPDATVRTFPVDTVAGLEVNTMWDRLFHVTSRRCCSSWPAWPGCGIGSATSGRCYCARWPGCWPPAGGWGLGNLVEGIVDHHVLRVHHVRDDVTNPLAWDLGILALGALLLLGGLAVYRSAQAHTP